MQGVMQVFLDQFSATIKEDKHVAMVPDSAGCHRANALKVPANITFIRPQLFLGAYSGRRVWEYLKDRYLSFRLHNDYGAIVDAARVAWNNLTPESAASPTVPPRFSATGGITCDP
jgi:hypothetical protein